MLKPLQGWLRALPFSDPLRREQAVLLQGVLAILMSAALAGTLISLAATSAVDRAIGVATSLLLALLLALAFVLLRRGAFTASLLVVELSLLALIFTNMLPTGLEGSRAIFAMLAIPLVLAGFVTSGRVLVLVMLLSCGVVVGVAALEVLAPGVAGYSDQTYDPLLTGLTFVVASGALALLIGRFGSALQAALRRSQQHEREMLEAKERAEAASRAKTAFLMTMSHELRTPLNAIVGYSEMLLEQAEADQLADYQDDLGEIRKAGLQLTSIIQDVLDMANLESGTIASSRRTFALDELCAELERALQPHLAGRGNTFVLDAPPALPPLTADREHLRQVLWRLLDNANKFTEHGRITLSVSVEQREGQPWLLLEVVDTGVGIPAAQLPQLFTPFNQGDMSSTRRHGGSGLGLAISHGLCRVMGGELTIDSEERRGSTCRVRLPVGG